MNELHGAGVALITPFNAEGEIDYDTLAQLIDFQIKNGVDYLVSLGTTGETATLTAEERKNIWEFTSNYVNKRIPLVAGIGGNNTNEVTKEIKNFNKLDYIAILSVSPYYSKPSQEGIYQHYKAISQVSELPILLYNVPGRTGSNISAETTVRLARDFKNIIGTKEASGDFLQFGEILRDKPNDFLLISGDDPATLPMMALGAVGVISVVGNAYPDKVSALTHLCKAGNFHEARVIHSALLRITALCFIEGNPGGIKYILEKKGIGKNALRLPLVSISENTKSLIEKEMLLLG